VPGALGDRPPRRCPWHRRWNAGARPSTPSARRPRGRCLPPAGRPAAPAICPRARKDCAPQTGRRYGCGRRCSCAATASRPICSANTIALTLSGGEPRRRETDTSPPHAGTCLGQRTTGGPQCSKDSRPRSSSTTSRSARR
jgi:hypothetical protein